MTCTEKYNYTYSLYLYSLTTPEDDDAMLLTDAFIMFLSFATFGCIPIIVFFIGPFNFTTDHNLFIASTILSMSILFALGVMKSTFSSANWLYSGLESLLLGLLCTALSYAVGASVMEVISYL